MLWRPLYNQILVEALLSYVIAYIGLRLDLTSPEVAHLTESSLVLTEPRDGSSLGVVLTLYVGVQTTSLYNR